jgi:hypothetical protein
MRSMLAEVKPTHRPRRGPQASTQNDLLCATARHKRTAVGSSQIGGYGSGG